MRKILLLSGLLTLSTLSYTQITVANNNNVGIGTDKDYVPTAKLEIKQSTSDQGLYITEPNNSQTISLHLANNVSGEYGFLALGGATRLRGNGQISEFDGKLNINLSDKSGPAGKDGFHGIISSDNENFSFIVSRNGTEKAKGFLFWNADEAKTLARIRVDESFIISNLGIGTTSPTEKLHVAGNVKANSFIDAQGNVRADYVFEKYYEGTSSLKADYSMPTLEEVEAFTKQHKHLPEIPSYQEVQEKGGVDLGELSNLLLQKIEELTLYTIEQEKQLQKLQETVKQQAEEMQQLKQAIKE